MEKQTELQMIMEKFDYPPEYYQLCAQTLATAFNQVPLYKSWRKFDLGPSVPLWQRFAALPVLTKALMRESFPTGLMPENQNLATGLADEEIEYTFTSGTTAEKVINIWDQNWWDNAEKAAWQLNYHLAQLSYPQKQAKLASSLNVGINCEEDLPMSHRLIGNTLYLNEKISLIQWQDRHLSRMVKELNEYQPVIFEVNPSLLARLAWWALDHKLTIYSPQVIVFTFEFPSAIHLKVIKDVFSSALVSSYGTTESGFVLQQCEDGFLHQNTDFVHIDFLPLKQQDEVGNLGRIYVTTFNNPWNYVIRFDAGDLVRLADDGNCSCGGNRGILVKDIEGRVANVTFTTKGKLVSTKMLDDQLAKVEQLRDYHLEQLNKTTYLLEVMLAPETAEKEAFEQIKATLREVYGSDGTYEIQLKETILPGPAGKFRRTQANFGFEESELFL